VEELALSPNGQWLSAGGLSFEDLGQVTRTFRLPSMEEGHFLLHGIYGEQKIAFSANGERIVTAGMEDADHGGDASGFARVWDTRSGRQLCKIPNSASINALALNKDGTLLATSGFGLTIRLWSIPGDRER